MSTEETLDVASDSKAETPTETLSPEQLKQMVDLGKKMASKPVLNALIVLVNSVNSPKSAKLAKKIKKTISYNYSGFIQAEFDDLEFKLNICLSLVDRDYTANIDVPSLEYAKDLYEKYNYLKHIAIAYWVQYTEDNKKLYAEICAHLNTNAVLLQVDETNPTTLFFDPDCAKRVGIFPYYVDANNKPYYKKT